jgi:hypothetical protein
MIDLPEVDHPDAKSIFRSDVATSLVKAVIESWAPSDVTWAGRPAEAQGATIREVEVGWATYLSSERVTRC